MLAERLHLLAEIGPGGHLGFIFIAAIVTAFVFYIGIVLWALLRTKDVQQQKIRYQVFRDLLDLFRRGKRK